MVPGLVFLSFPGEVHLIREKMVHFPREKWQNGAEINIFEGKVHQIRGKMVHFPDTDKRRGSSGVDNFVTR